MRKKTHDLFFIQEKMIPQIFSENTAEVYSYRQPDYTYRVNDSSVAGHVDRLEALRQSIRHILGTERFGSVIYDDNYGVEMEQYVGKDIGYITASIGDTLRDALTQDDRITDVIINDVSRSTEQESACTVDFTVQTIYGDTEETIDVVQ